jgi:hypothetical protein
MAQDENLTVGWIRPAVDDDEETELLCVTTAERGLGDTIFACAFAFAETNTTLAGKIALLSNEAIGALFDGIVASNEPELWGSTLHASDEDIETLRAAGDIRPSFWHSALTIGVLMVKSRGHTKRMAKMLADYKRDGVLQLTRDDIGRMIPA